MLISRVHVLKIMNANQIMVCLCVCGMGMCVYMHACAFVHVHVCVHASMCAVDLINLTRVVIWKDFWVSMNLGANYEERRFCMIICIVFSGPENSIKLLLISYLPGLMVLHGICSVRWDDD